MEWFELLAIAGGYKQLLSLCLACIMFKKNCFHKKKKKDPRMSLNPEKISSV